MIRKLCSRMVVGFAGAFVCAAPSAAQTCADAGVCCNEGLQPIAVPVGVPEAFDQFGKAVAIDGNRLVVGEQVGDAGPVQDSGSAYVYEFVAGEWQYVQSVAPGPTEGDLGDLFGGSVAISGDVIVVGSKGDQGTGSAYVFEWNETSWIQVAHLFAPVPQVGAEFGHAVAVSGDWVVVGSHFEDGIEGSVHVYRRHAALPQWEFSQTLLPFPLSYNSEFGWSVAIDGDVIVVGAPGVPQGSSDIVGFAYVFRYDPGSTPTWPQDGDSISVGQVNDHFGKAVAVEGDVIAITANGADDVGADAGMAYVFRRTSPGPATPWQLERKVPPCDPMRQDEYGWSVSLSGGLLVVGALDRPLMDPPSGAQVYRRLDADWVRVRTLVDANGAQPLSWFGWAVATNGDAVVSADPRYMGVAQDDGAIYASIGLATAATCGCRSDLNGDGAVDIDDVEVMFASWGPCPAGNCPVCATDLDGNCTTGAGDLEIVLDCWGPCLWPGSVPPPQSIQNCLDQYGQSPIRLATCLELVLGGS